jgi:hypothetical protein
MDQLSAGKINSADYFSATTKFGLLESMARIFDAL